MIELRSEGSLFEAGAQAIVNPVNCVGTMGAGLAAEFKRRYPAMYKEYAKLCKKSYIKIGKVWVWHEHEKPCNEEPCGYVINFPTKDDWRRPSKLEWIASGLDDLAECATMNGIKSIAVPALGCGYGGLDFELVKKLVYEKLDGLPTHIILFEPQ